MKRKFKLKIDLIPYEVTEITIPGTIIKAYVMENIFGVEGINTLKRYSPYMESSGQIPDMFCMVSIDTDKNELEFHCDSEKVLMQAVGYIQNAYPSVGWECLLP